MVQPYKIPGGGGIVLDACCSSSTAERMVSKSTQIMGQTWIARTMKTKMWILIISCLLQYSLGSLLESNATLNVSSNRCLIYSECSNMSVQKLQSDRSDLKFEISFDFLALARDLSDAVLEFDRQKLEIVQQSKVVRINCGLKALCLETFELRALLKPKPRKNVGFVVDFMSVNSMEFMYIKQGIAKFINRESFKHFQNANIEIDIKNKSSHLIFVQTEHERKLLNHFEGKCYCKLSSTMKNLNLHQLGVKRTLKKVIYSLLELSMGLKIALPDNIQNCLQEFLNDGNCKLNQTARSKRSIFSSSDHDSLRRITKIFESNFQNILSHERARKFELETMNHKINSEEAGLMEIRSYLKSVQLIDRLHRLQNDFYLLFIENLNILDIDLKNSDLVRILKLFRYKHCQFLNLVNACVYLDNFRVEKNVIHANFQHNAPRMMNFTMFSCRVVEFEGNYLINGLHNQVVGPTDIHRYNKTRPVQASDFVLKNLEVIATREIINKEECYTLFCLANLSFYQNSTLIYCNKGKTKVFLW